MPWTYRNASKEWRAILEDLKDRMQLDSDNSAYTAMDAVFRVFRRRLTAQQGLDFAAVLPAIPRAIFVADWKIESSPVPFSDRETLVSEVQRVRPHHNLTPRHAIEATAWTVRRYTNKLDFDRVLAGLPAGSIEFWHVDVADPRELQQRIF